MDDPIFIPIEQLETKGGQPADFYEVAKDMKAGKRGSRRIEKGRKGLGKEYIATTFYYAALNDSEYSFAFCFTDSDKVHNV